MLGWLDLVNNLSVEGWAYDPEHPSDPVAVEIRDGDQVIGHATANLFRKDLEQAGIGDGHHNFKFNLPLAILDGRDHSLSVRCVGLETQLENSPQTLEGKLLARGLILESGLFDDSWYCNAYPHVRNCGMDPLDHYLRIGAVADYAPSAAFDPVDYASRYSYDSLVGTNPLLHYLIKGRGEGYTIHSISRRHERALVLQSELFDESWYTRAYPEAARSPLTPLDYYLEHGAMTAPSMKFDPRDYVARYPDVLRTGTHPLVYFLSTGLRMGDRAYSLSRCRERALVLASELFDERWYSETYLSNKNNLDAADDFLENGVAIGRCSSPRFDSVDYLERYKDVADAGINPLIHYIQDGRREGRTIYGMGRRQDRLSVIRSGLFDSEWYMKAYPHVRHSGKEPIDHYLDQGGAAGYAPSPLFDTASYLARYPSVMVTGKNALLHFLNDGEAEHCSAESLCQGPAVQLTRTPKPIRLIPRLAHPPTVVAAVCIDSLAAWEEASRYFENMPGKYMIILLSTAVPFEELKAAVADKQLRVKIVIPQLPLDGSLAGALIDMGEVIAQYDLLFYLNLQGTADSTLNRPTLRAMTLKSLLGSPYLAMSIFQLFEEDKQCGVIYGDVFPDASQWARNWRPHGSRMRDFLRSLHFPYAEDDVPLFPCSSMFWARISAIRPLLRAQVRDALPFNDPELASMVSWCFERALGIVVHSRGYEIVQLSYRSGCYWTAAGSFALGGTCATSTCPLRTTSGVDKLVAYNN